MAIGNIISKSIPWLWDKAESIIGALIVTDYTNTFDHPLVNQVRNELKQQPGFSDIDLLAQGKTYMSEDRIASADAIVADTISNLYSEDAVDGQVPADLSVFRTSDDDFANTSAVSVDGVLVGDAEKIETLITRATPQDFCDAALQLHAAFEVIGYLDNSTVSLLDALYSEGV